MDPILAATDELDHSAGVTLTWTRHPTERTKTMRDPDNPLEACDQALGYVDSVLRLGAAERETTAVPVAVVLLRVALAVHALVAILGATGSLLGLH